METCADGMEMCDVWRCVEMFGDVWRRAESSGNGVETCGDRVEMGWRHVKSCGDVWRQDGNV